MSRKTVTLTDRPDVPGSGDGVTVVFGAAHRDAAYAPNVRSSAEYVEEPIISDEDYDTLRGWLGALPEYDGISLGSLVESPFIPLYGEELVRQTRIVQSILEVEDPDLVRVDTADYAVYEWLETNVARVHVGVVKAVCDSADVPVEVDFRHSLRTITDKAFRFGGPTALRLSERATETYGRISTPSDTRHHDVLVYLMNTKNLGLIKPVIEELTARGKPPLIIFHPHGFFNIGTEDMTRLKELNVPVRRFESYQDAGVYQAERDLRHRLRDEWILDSNDSEFQSRFKLDGVNMWPALKDRFWLYYALQFPRAARYVETTRQVLRAERPGVVFVKGDGPIPNRTFVTVANDNNVPTMILQHGKGQSSRRFSVPSRHVAVWGELGAEFYSQKGQDSEDVTVTGAPHFDALQETSFDESEIRSNLGIPATHDVVMLASQTYSKDIRQRILDVLVESVESRTDVTLLLRPHPRDETTLLEKYDRTADVPTVRASDTNIHDLIAVSDVVCSVDSTVLFEAGLLDTPALVLDFTGREIQPFWRTEGYTVVSHADELPEVIRRILEDSDFYETVIDSQPGFGSRYAMNGDGRATERVVDLLLDFAAEQPDG